MKKLEIFDEIMRRFYQKEAIEDEMFFYIAEIMAERFVESREDSEWQCYEPLLTKLNKIWQYRQCEELSSEQSYLYGGIWGCLSMLSYIKKKKETSEKCHVLAKKYVSGTSFVFLNSIYNNPGVQNKKLAELCNVTPARISQITNEALQEGVISVRVFGKEKSYYMRTLGESVFGIIWEQKDKLAQNANLFDYKVLEFSNEDNDFVKRIMVLNLMDEMGYGGIKAVAVAYKENEKISSENTFDSRIGKENNLCIQKTSNLNRNYVNFWEPQMEVDMMHL